jgi:hypothetical protein
MAGEAIKKLLGHCRLARIIIHAMVCKVMEISSRVIPANAAIINEGNRRLRTG